MLQQDTPTLLHCAAMGAHNSIIQLLILQSYPPMIKSKRAVDFINDVRMCFSWCYV